MARKNRGLGRGLDALIPNKTAEKAAKEKAEKKASKKKKEKTALLDEAAAEKKRLAALKERLTGRPFLTITDEGIIYSGGWKQYDIRFADVNSFAMLGGRQNKIIGIHYKMRVERQKMEDASFIGRLARKFNLTVSGTQESISLSGVPMKAHELCDLLNERLKRQALTVEH